MREVKVSGHRGAPRPCELCGQMVVSVCDELDMGEAVTCHYEPATSDEKDAVIASLREQRDRLMLLAKGIMWLVDDNGCDEDAPRTLNDIARNVQVALADVVGEATKLNLFSTML